MGYLGGRIAEANGKDPTEPLQPGDAIYIPSLMEFDAKDGKAYAFATIDIAALQKAAAKQSVVRRQLSVKRANATVSAAQRQDDGKWRTMDLGSLKSTVLSVDGEASVLRGLYGSVDLYSNKGAGTKLNFLGVWAGAQWGYGGASANLNNGKISPKVIGLKVGPKTYIAEGSFSFDLGPFSISLGGSLGAGAELQMGMVPGNQEVLKVGVTVGAGLSLGLGLSDAGVEAVKNMDWGPASVLLGGGGIYRLR